MNRRELTQEELEAARATDPYWYARMFTHVCGERANPPYTPMWDEDEKRVVWTQPAVGLGGTLQ